ncbi:phage holin family protein [uncultured Nitrospira sp.]|uniref:phage holin family protein n=1 Tax=uncultured Nitrospira sp. TaxID=157176 RepID=UPI003140BC4C
MDDTQGERRLSELLSDLMRQVKFFFQHELQLFKSEISLKVSQAGKDLALIAVGGAIVYAGVLVLLIAATLALALVIPGWASALIIGIVAIGVGYALLQRGINDLKHMNASPTQTFESLKETKEWITHAIN